MKRQTGENFGLFLKEKLKNCILNEKLDAQNQDSFPQN